ncbi:MAG: hypothetical protein FJ170_03220 [Gammaproteobacteria bacterium]|nr:hypothetical protein [Gammaproteobacteria bacterium]
MNTHLLWTWLHIVLFVYWLGADVGVYLVMVFVKNPKLGFETRATLIRLGFLIDQFPRITFALILPVGMQLARNLDLYPSPDWLLALAWTAGILWSALHLAVVAWKGTALARRLLRINQLHELFLGGFFIAVGTLSLLNDAPIAADWFAVKLLLFGLIFWVVLGIDMVFQPFTMILRMGVDGSTPEKEQQVTRATNITMAWAVLLYLLVLAVAFLGTVKPSW